MKTAQKVIVATALFATSIFSASAIAKTTKATKAPAASPAVIEKQVSDEQRLDASLNQGYQMCLSNALLLADVSKMRQGGVSETDAKKKFNEIAEGAPKETQEITKKRLNSLIENVYAKQPIQKTDAEKLSLVESVKFGEFYDCSIAVGYSLAGGK